MDGFLLTHAYERVDLPSKEEVDAYLPPFQPRQVLDPAEPVSIGAMVGPDAYMEVRYLAHQKQLRALARIPELSEEFREQFGRESGGLLRTYRTDDAECIVVALGSINGTIQDVVDELREKGMRIGSVSICSFRPFPFVALRRALDRGKRVVVVEKSLAVGLGGILSNDVQTALAGIGIRHQTVIAGLGGRAITKASLRRCFEASVTDAHELTFLDLDRDLIQRHLEREAPDKAQSDLRVIAAEIG